MLEQMQKFETRQRKAQAYLAARRDELEPVKLERNLIVKELEIQLARFAAGAIPDLKTETLQPLHDAAVASHTAFDPFRLLRHLHSEADMAEKLCARYEKEFDIYTLAEKLPESELRLAELKNRMSETARQLDRLTMELEPLDNLPAPRQGLSHVMSMVFSSTYRHASALHREMGDISAKQQEQNRLQQELLVREVLFETQQAEVERQRNWVMAYVTAWTSRARPQQDIAAMREAFCDALQDTLYRHHIAALFGRRFPVHIETIFSTIDQLDRQARRFISDFDARFSTDTTA